MSVSLDQIELADLWADPYPIYAQLRRQRPVAWVETTGRYLITRQQDVLDVERNTAVFRNSARATPAERAMGEVILRKDDAEHRRQRSALEGPLKPRAIKDHWLPLFQKNAEGALARIADAGAADLVTSYASPLAAQNLLSFLGLQGVTTDMLVEWCDAIIVGSGNYGDDPEIWARCDRANAEIDAVIDESEKFLREHPDPSVLCAMMNADDPLTEAQIRGNIKVVIGGGLNEPRDALLVGSYGLLSNPAQRADVMDDETLWKKVFEEAVRWVAPIGMYPREVMAPVEVAGVQLEVGDQVGLVVASANRDESVYERPDEFDIHRPVTQHVGFGAGGPHFCAGAWIARASVGQAALPTLFGRLRNLRLDESRPTKFGGWVFRGPTTMPVVWDV